MQTHQQICHSMVPCRSPVVRIRPGNVPWWILGTVREVFALPRRLSILHRRHTVCGSGGHGPPPRHGLLSGLLHAPGPHQHGGRLPLPSQQGKNIYCRLSHLERLCTLILFCWSYLKEKLELDFSLSWFIGLKGKYCFSKCHSSVFSPITSLSLVFQRIKASGLILLEAILSGSVLLYFPVSSNTSSYFFIKMKEEDLYSSLSSCICHYLRKRWNVWTPFHCNNLAYF